MLGEQEFKSLRHRFYKLGRKRDISILEELGKLSQKDELPSHDDMRNLLQQINNEGRVYDLIEWIRFHEDQVQEETNEKF